ncbi:MAG: carboxypeptidase regulatory-like domain-containing protein [Vicinamibacterales bacterium]
MIRLLLFLAVYGALLAANPAAAQGTATLRGTVTDELGGVLPGVDIRLTRAVTGLARHVVTGPDGRFELANLPWDRYDLHAELAGFDPQHVVVPLRTSVPEELMLVLRVAARTEVVRVSPAPQLVDPTLTGTRTQVSFVGIEQLPAPVGSRGVESVLVTLPGFAQNANGAIHPRGAHNQMTFVVDGLPISDQLTGAFANALDAGLVQSAELWTGNIPAEFGAKVSGVVVITSRSGLGASRMLTGDATLAAGGFGTWHASAQGGGERGRLGYYASATTMRTDRFLDQVSLDNLHNSGAFGRGFGRVDLRLSPTQTLRGHVMGGASQFELANLRSQERNGQDQRQRLSDVAAWGAYTATLGRASTVEIVAGRRGTRAALDPSAGDTPVTAWQNRSLSTATFTTRLTRLLGPHSIRAGVDLQRVHLRESFFMGLTRADFNAPGSDGFNPSLLPFDLTRGGSRFTFDDRRRGRHLSGFAQAQIQWGPAALTLGARYDHYALLVHETQLQPRIGVAWALPGQWGVARASYNRNFQTPPLENLLVSSSPQAAALAPASVQQALGSTYRPLRPERQQVVEVGYQRALGRVASLDVSAYRKHSFDQQDNNNFFDTGIIFPTTLAEIEVRGAEARLVFPERRGLSGTLSMTTSRAISTPPFTGGLFLGQDSIDLLTAGPFYIDHDQRLSLHGTAQWRSDAGWWVGASARYDSGLVANPSDPAGVAADPDFADLLPYVDLEAGVPRVRPRAVIDLVSGIDLHRGGRRAWSLQLQVTNLTNRTALYNFQSVFVGTRLIQPRTVALRIKRRF